MKWYVAIGTIGFIAGLVIVLAVITRDLFNQTKKK